MRSRIKLKLQQSEMRGRIADDQAVQAARRLPALRRKYLALVLVHTGSTVQEIADRFGWDKEKVRSWIQVGNSLCKLTRRNRAA